MMAWAAVCYKMKVLPHTGGLFDQDPWHVAILQTYIASMMEKERREADKDKPSKLGRRR